MGNSLNSNFAGGASLKELTNLIETNH